MTVAAERIVVTPSCSPGLLLAMATAVANAQVHGATVVADDVYHGLSVDGSRLAHLDEESVLVNTGRGAVLDEDALVAALDEGYLKTAGLDVLGEEPPPEDHPLVGREDVVVTPHAGRYSEDARPGQQTGCDVPP